MADTDPVATYLAETGEQLARGTVIYSCPLPGCAWVHVEPPPGPAEDPLCLADVFGVGVFSGITHAQRLAGTETRLADHCGTHPASEWVPVVAGLQDKLTKAETALAVFGDALGQLGESHHDYDGYCGFCDYLWPCPTRRIIDTVKERS